jgi:aspartyl-tRNA(Asn)/glutamyl-tRNA(Gln) amidotransferase subunit B
MTYKLTLGLELHIQVNSARKMFCGCDASIWQAEPNTHTCPTCLGLPGALPVPSCESVQKTQLLGLALNCKVNTVSHFDRKHYFYPDLPKGYQISQYKEPLCGQGHLDLANGKRITIERIHLEEDTAKSVHEGTQTLIDFNKSGIALIEIVTTPCFTAVADAVDFCKKIQDIARVLAISEADMEKGNMRLEANISLRTEAMEQTGELANYKVEVKNINSFKFMEKAVVYEVQRQTDLLAAGETPRQENRGWDERKGGTVAQRDKEAAHDYRYFPDPDIPPMLFDAAYFADLQSRLPELPYQLRSRLLKDYGLNAASADFFSTGSGIALVPKYEAIAKQAGNPQKVANLLINKPDCRVLSVEAVAKLVTASTGDTAPGSETAINAAVAKVLAANESAVQSYKSGKLTALQFLLGAVIKETGGRVDAKAVSTVLKKELDSSFSGSI